MIFTQREYGTRAVLRHRRVTWDCHLWRWINGSVPKTNWEKSLDRWKQRQIDKIKNYLMEIGVQDGKTVAHDNYKWKSVGVAVVGLNEIWKTYEKKVNSPLSDREVTPNICKYVCTECCSKFWRINERCGHVLK